MFTDWLERVYRWEKKSAIRIHFRTNEKDKQCFYYFMYMMDRKKKNLDFEIVE